MQKSNRSRKKKLVKLLAWIAGILIAMMVVFTVVGLLLKQGLPDRIKQVVHEESAGDYTLEFEEMQVNVLRGKISAKKIHLIPDAARDQHPEDTLKKRQRYDVKADALSIVGFKWLKYLITKRIDIRDIQVNRPTVRFMNIGKESKEERAKEGALWDKLPKALHGAGVHKLSIFQLKFKKQSYTDSLESGGWLENLNIQVDDLRLDKASLNDTTRYWFAADIRLFGKDILYTSPSGLYRLRVKKMEASAAFSQWTVDSFTVKPKFSEREWSATLKYKQDRYDMSYPRIVIKGINFKKLQRNKRLAIDHILISNGQINIYADKGMPEKTTIASNNFPSLAFQRLGLPVTVQRIKIANMDVNYKELNPKSGRAGLVFFKALEGSLVNVSNDTLLLKQNPWLKCHFATLFLGKPRLTVDLAFNMVDKNGAFNYTGTLAGAPASFYNQLLEPITLARAEEGTIHGVHFRVKANRYGADVFTEMLYSDLKVAVLDVTTGKLEKKGFLSLFVNWLAVKTNNPSKRDEPARVAQHYYQHPQEKTFFNLMWKAVYSGLKVNLGLPNI